MERFIAIAVLSFVALNAARLEAQFRGGGGHVGGAVHSGGGVRSAPAPAPGRASPAPAPVRPMGGPIVHGPATFNGRPAFNGGGRFREPFIRPAFGVPVYSYPAFGFYDPYLYAGAPAYSEYPESSYVSVQAPPFESNQVNQLTAEVDQLRAEVDSLRQQTGQVLLNAPAFQPVPPVTRPALPTVLVFRDGRQIEAQGYAVIGQTIWVLTEQTSTRMQLSDLDVEATQRINAERGVRFLLPRTN